MSETFTIIGLLESLPPETADILRKEALRTGRSAEDLLREGLLALADRIAPSITRDGKESA